MTGYPSKKAAAQDKLNDDDDTQVYKDHGDALTIAYQSGYYDGKKAAQPAQEPLCPECKAGVLYECVACSSNNYPPQQYANPMAWAVCDKREGSKSLHWPEQHSPDGDATMFDAVPLVPQRPWVDLTPEEILDLFDSKNVYGSKWVEFARAVEAKLREKNT